MEFALEKFHQYLAGSAPPLPTPDLYLVLTQSVNYLSAPSTYLEIKITPDDLEFNSLGVLIKKSFTLYESVRGYLLLDKANDTYIYYQTTGLPPGTINSIQLVYNTSRLGGTPGDLYLWDRYEGRITITSEGLPAILKHILLGEWVSNSITMNCQDKEFVDLGLVATLNNKVWEGVGDYSNKYLKFTDYVFTGNTSYCEVYQLTLFLGTLRTATITIKSRLRVPLSEYIPIGIQLDGHPLRSQYQDNFWYDADPYNMSIRLI